MVVVDVRAAPSPTTAMVPERFRVEDFLDSWKLADNSAVREVHKAWPTKRLAISDTVAPLLAKAFTTCGPSDSGDSLGQRVRPAGRVAVSTKTEGMVEAMGPCRTYPPTPSCLRRRGRTSST